MYINNVEYRPLIYKDQITNYNISEFGDVINYKTGHILTPNINTNGRKYVCITINGVCYTETIHRLVYLAFYGDIPDDMTINHKNEDFLDNYYKNLELMTRGNNTKEYLKNNGGTKKIYSDTIIEAVCSELKNGIYYRDVANAFNMPIDYVYKILSGKKRTFVSEKYIPFPDTAKIRRHVRKIPHEYIQSLIIQGFTTDEIYDVLGLDHNSTNNKMISRERSVVSIKDPKYFSEKYINNINDMIKDGKSNNEIYSILNIKYNSRVANLIARKRQKFGIPDFNENGVLLSTQKEMMDDIYEGLSNSEIFDKYNLVRNDYTIRMIANLRQKCKNAKKKGSTTIERIS